MMGETLQELLQRSGLLTPAQIAAAVEDAALRRKRLPETLIDLGYITERRFAEWMSAASGTPLIDPLPEETAWVLQNRITAGVARELEVVPVRQLGDELYVATVNPLDDSAMSVLRATTGMEIKPVTGVRSAIERLVDRLYKITEDAADITMLGRPPAANASQADEPFGTVAAIRPAEERDTLPPIAPKSDDSTAETNPFVEMERRLEQLAKMIQKMQRQLDGIEQLLTRVAQRR